MPKEVIELSYRILIVDDEPDICDLLCILLRKNGYMAQKAGNARAAIEILHTQPPFDLVIMDIMMPGMDGVTACREIRAFSNIPTLFLTAKTGEDDKRKAIENGGDDYLGKPFSEAELLMRVSSLTRRYRVYQAVEQPSNAKKIGSLLVDPESHLVIKNGEAVALTEKEYAILQFFIRRRGTAVDIRSIYESVWKEQYLSTSSNTVMVHILNLRKKLEDDPSQPALIRTIWGKGYQID